MLTVQGACRAVRRGLSIGGPTLANGKRATDCRKGDSSTMTWTQMTLNGDAGERPRASASAPRETPPGHSSLPEEDDHDQDRRGVAESL